MNTINLSTLENGATAYVRSVSASAEMCRRLYDLGFLPGERVERLYASPLGTPVVFRVMNQSVALRRREAAAIEVTPQPVTDIPTDDDTDVAPMTDGDD